MSTQYNQILELHYPNCVYVCDASAGYDGIDWLDENTAKPTQATLDALWSETDTAYKLKFLREERNKRLAETDWMGNSDVTMSTEWTTYRQALRDITDNATSLDDVTWPTKPE